MRYYHALVRSAALVFGIEVLFVAAYLFLRKEEWGAVLLVGACLSAAIGFAIAIVVHQFGFEHVAERSVRAAERLEAFLRALETRRGGRPHLNELAQATAGLAEILVEEQNSWHRQTSRLGVHL